MRDVIFLQLKFPKETVAIYNLLERWKNYRDLVKQRSPSELYLFSQKKNLEWVHIVFNSWPIPIIDEGARNKTFLVRAFLLNWKIRKGSQKFTLVLGDNQQSLIFALILKVFNCRKIRLQVQFHGNTYHPIANPGLRGFFRVLSSRIAIHFSDSIRIVSQFQQDEILRISPRSAGKFIVAPIPIDFSRVGHLPAHRDVDIALVGRLHPQRGIDEFTQIVAMVYSSVPNLRVVIAGDGVLQELIESKFSNQIRSGFLTNVGFLNSNELSQLYRRSKILISTAPTEGYGLTIREAALSGVHVIARASKGSIEAHETFPESIHLYDSLSESVKLILSYLEIESTTITQFNHNEQLKRDYQSMRNLVSSWLTD